MKNQRFILTVEDSLLGPYTTLLQSGIYLQCKVDQPIGLFLGGLPGFDMDYIVNRVQTIFLDGDAIDDMQSVFHKQTSVLALSAAMPGLAGAIFRKNSMHAALRTTSSDIGPETQSGESVTVRLKLFNMIAQEKGPAILQKGGIFTGRSLLNFFHQRKTLLENISKITTGDQTITCDAFISQLDPLQDYHLSIVSSLHTL